MDFERRGASAGEWVFVQSGDLALMRHAERVCAGIGKAEEVSGGFGGGDAKPTIDVLYVYERGVEPGAGIST